MDVSRKRGMFAEPDLGAKRYCTANPEYMAAFRTFDTDGSGNVDICELNNALQAVKRSVESNSTQPSRAFFPSPFNPNTVIWLAARFSAASGTIYFQQFAEMMVYLEGLKTIFAQIDTDGTGDISVSELSRALSLSGFSVTGVQGGGDALSLMVAERIGRAYDADKNGVLSFDEFVQLRLEWDCYLNAWGSHVPAGANTISPNELLKVLDSVKTSLEPVGALALQPALSGLVGFSSAVFLGGLMYTSMFKMQRPFQARTAELLIRKFSQGSLMVNFEQFCMMMEFLKDAKEKFVAVDVSLSGTIDVNELGSAFAASGLPMPLESLVALGRRYDQDNSGGLEFDEFVQMLSELQDGLS
mmetsp:Transcript_109809/g.338988  ORF Transcript_109809/g.338988 Transcript_109809/m.338988 type:complete len:357 (-) Transcript_109809:155-1225(-)